MIKIINSLIDKLAHVEVPILSEYTEYPNEDCVVITVKSMQQLALPLWSYDVNFSVEIFSDSQSQSMKIAHNVKAALKEIEDMHLISIANSQGESLVSYKITLLYSMTYEDEF